MGNITIQEHELFRLVMALTLFFLLLSLIIIGVMLAYGKRRQRHLLEVKDLEHRYNQNLLSSQIEIQENTLREISQELHDNISQQLGLVKLQLNQLQKQDDTGGIAETRAVVSQTIKDLRDLSHSLHPDRIAAFSFRENLLFELEKMKRLGNLEIEENIEPDAGNLKMDKKVILYRVVQELLNNCLRHAQASFISIGIRYTPTHVHLHLSDNGLGMNPEQKAGIGLISIKNRLDLLKGVMQMENRPGKGLEITIEVPL